MWRGIVFSFGISCLLGFVYGFISVILGGKPIFAVSFLLGLITSAVTGMWIIKKVLQKDFGTFRLAVLKSISQNGDK